jgi:AAA15 family ATPase/GTPase
MFKDKRYNKRNAQLVFTAHNTDILDVDVLRISEVAIVRKNIKEGTSLRSLSSFEGIRNVTNFRKQYLSGAFSGIPHSYI